MGVCAQDALELTLGAGMEEEVCSREIAVECTV